MNMRVTATDIAAAAGVSQPTVSQILNGKGDRYSVLTRSKVHEAVRQLGYRPSSAARSMIRGRTGNVALLLGEQAARSKMHVGLLDGVQAELAAQNLHLMLARVADADLVDVDFVPNILQEWTSDGLLINYTHGYPTRMLDLIRRFAVPTIWLNTLLKRDCVRPDDQAAGFEATTELLRAGHRNIALVAYQPTGHYSNLDRRQGYEQAMQQAGLTPRIISYPEEGFARDEYGGRFIEFTRSWMTRTDRPTGILTTEDWDLHTVLGGALRVGLSIPRDLSIVALRAGQVSDTHLVDIPVTSYWVPFEQVGRRAVQMLVDRLEGDGEPVPTVVIPFQRGQRGATVAAPPAQG